MKREVARGQQSATDAIDRKNQQVELMSGNQPRLESIQWVAEERERSDRQKTERNNENSKTGRPECIHTWVSKKIRRT